MFLHKQKQHNQLQDSTLPMQLKRKESLSDDDLREKITQIGSKIKIQWTIEEIGDSGWKPGWYTTTVQRYCNDTDIVTVTYASEPNHAYDEDLLTLISGGQIKLLWSPLQSLLRSLRHSSYTICLYTYIECQCNYAYHNCSRIIWYIAPRKIVCGIECITST